MPLKLLKQLELFENFFPDAIHQCVPLYEQIAVEGEGNLYQRSNMLGHVTASAFIVNHMMTHVLLISHRVLGITIPPGGHIDPGEDPYEAAIREAMEETGLAVEPHIYPGTIVDVDTHPIPARLDKGESVHRHHDLMFAFFGDMTAPLRHQDDEVGSARWVHHTDIPEERSRRIWRRLPNRII